MGFGGGSVTGRFTPTDPAILSQGTELELDIPNEYEHGSPDPELPSTLRDPVLAKHHTTQKKPIKVQEQTHVKVQKGEEYYQLGEKNSDNQTAVKLESIPASSICKCHRLPQTVLAIKSIQFDRKYVRMLSHQGSVGIGTVLEASDTFELVRHVRGMVSFRSTTQVEGYLSANGEGIAGG